MFDEGYTDAHTQEVESEFQTDRRTDQGDPWKDGQTVRLTNKLIVSDAIMLLL